MARVADGVLGEAAVDRVAHVLLGLAQRLAAGVAVAAIAARVSEPRKRDTHPDLDPVALARAELRDDPDALVAGDEGRRRLDRPLATSRVDVGVTETRSLDTDENLLGTGLRHRHVLDDQRLVEGMNNCGLHLVPPRVFASVAAAAGPNIRCLHGQASGIPRSLSARRDRMLVPSTLDNAHRDCRASATSWPHGSAHPMRHTRSAG